jgi:hypothetical protein
MNLKIRVALREEGQFWNAYIAKHDTMEGAMLIGSIVMSAVKNNIKIKHAFQSTMKQILADAIKNTGGIIGSWDFERAPESERSGHA